jgi:hypothetical protein
MSQDREYMSEMEFIAKIISHNIAKTIEQIESGVIQEYVIPRWPLDLDWDLEIAIAENTERVHGETR